MGVHGQIRVTKICIKCTGELKKEKERGPAIEIGRQKDSSRHLASKEV